MQNERFRDCVEISVNIATRPGVAAITRGYLRSRFSPQDVALVSLLPRGLATVACSTPPLNLNRLWFRDLGSNFSSCVILPQVIEAYLRSETEKQRLPGSN